ncbi:MAG: 50S ribosomal protein L9 [Alphaproteobacteria bacterium]|nr:50S ribosomal protein L9 [Alphaproteobacteria bacterium]
MEVILLERVAHVGQMGDVVRVKPGFARNFLLPQKKALRATDANKKYFETKRKELEATNLHRKQEADAVAAKMKDFTVTLIRQASESLHLYGSVSARDIAEAVIAAGIKIERRQIELPKPIKTLGKHIVEVHLHPEVMVDIGVLVARSTEEAEFLASGGTLVAETERRAQELAAAAQAAEQQAAALLEKPAAPAEGEAAPAGKAETDADAGKPA